MPGWWFSPGTPVSFTNKTDYHDIIEILLKVHLTREGFKLTTLVVIGTDCIGSYKSNYHMITTMTVPYTGY
jgi:hypothetical protein